MGQLLGTKTYIVMPNNTSQVKIDLVKLYNGEIHFSGPTQNDLENLLEKVH
jgi:threonine dehydratase